MSHSHRVALSAFLASLVAAACGGGSSSPASPSASAAATLSSIAVSGATSIAGVGQSSQLTATARYSNGTTQVVTPLVTWETSDPAVASVSPSGLCTAVAYGLTDVRARYEGVTGTTQVKVLANLAGTWLGTWQSYWLGGHLAATFTQLGETVSGTATISDAFCFPQPVQVTGPVSGGTVKLTGSPNGIAILTITGTVDSSGRLFTGTDTVTAGGNCSAADGTFTLRRQ